MFRCEFCGKDTLGIEPTKNWTITETFANLTFTASVTANLKLCNDCIKSFVITKTEAVEVKPPTPTEPEEPAPTKKRGRRGV